MNTGMDDDVSNIKNIRKTAVISSELYRFNVDIVSMQKTRLASQGSIKEKDYTFSWCEKSIHERREHGVGFAVKNSLLKVLELGEDENKRLLPSAYIHSMVLQFSLAFMLPPCIVLMK